MGWNAFSRKFGIECQTLQPKSAADYLCRITPKLTGHLYFWKSVPWARHVLEMKYTMATYNPTFFYSLLTFLHFWIKNSLDCNIFLFPLRSKEAKHDRMKEQQNYWKITDNHKSVNLQYHTLGCLDDGTNELSTKRLMFQVLFFFMISCKILCKNPFNLFSYFFL